MSLLSQHVRVVSAMMIRETTTRYGGKFGGYLWAFVDPVAHVVLMTLIFRAMVHIPALGTSFAMFFATGFLPWMFYNSMTTWIGGTIRANKALLSYPVVSPIDALVARYIVQTGTSVAVAAIVMWIVAAIDHTRLSVDAATLAAATATATLMGFGIGFINITLYARFPLYEKFYTMASRPLFFMSGVFFLTDSIPKPYSEYMLWNPIAHVIMWFRAGVYSEYRPHGLDPAYAIWMTAIYIAVGMVLLTVSGREIREGSA